MSNTNKLEAAQNKAIRNMAGVKYNCHTLPIYSENTLLKASDLAYTAQVLTVYKFRRDWLPLTFHKLFKYSYESGDREQRDSALNFHVPITSGQGSELFPFPEFIKFWNKLPFDYKSLTTVKSFKSQRILSRQVL